jgi:hypothetical protein
MQHVPPGLVRLATYGSEQSTLSDKASVVNAKASERTSAS